MSLKEVISNIKEKSEFKGFVKGKEIATLFIEPCLKVSNRYDRIAGHYNYTYTTYPHNMGNVLIYDRIISADDVKGIYYARTFYRDTLH